MPIASTYTTARVAITHPNRQHVNQTVVAAEHTGCLDVFLTGFAYQPLGTVANILRVVPGSHAVQKRLLRRAAPDVAASHIKDFRFAFALGVGQVLAYRRLQSRSVHKLQKRLDREFDRRCAAWLQSYEGCNVVHCFEDAAYHTLGVARERGFKSVLDVPSAHEFYLAEDNKERVALGLKENPVTREPLIADERSNADLILSASDYVSNCLIANGVAPSRIRLVPYGTDTTAFSPVGARRKRSGFKAAFIGRASLRKGLRYLLEAWSQLRLPSAQLLVAGGVDAEVRAVVRPDDENVVWLGNLGRREIRELYQRIDVLVLPSVAEAFGLVVHEAMASEVPVIISDACGAPMRDGTDGFVVPSRSVDALADRIATMHRKPELRYEMGVQARRYIAANYSVAAYEQRLLAVYNELISLG